MSRTVIDLDDTLVAEVAQVLGTCTVEQTVNTALRQVLETRRLYAAAGPYPSGDRAAQGR
ncbi:type II toxin-antitoxin system VapB family antitoxin [Streptomyces avicenniae]|uniref:type II toxin-antitoxin system VapB family antitoxin n=1 Tax=Streptomyces avicenniae TaxID=500153 RepID=UPI00069BA597|nr:type II toxin-antitoxin system VapB family antitoxin [Streptomyces avicenniae]